MKSIYIINKLKRKIKKAEMNYFEMYFEGFAKLKEGHYVKIPNDVTKIILCGKKTKIEWKQTKYL